MTCIREAATAAILLLLMAGAPPLRAQSAIVAVPEENFRAQPRGEVLAELLEGTILAIGRSEGRWREATLDAWIFARSVREQRSGDLDVVVNAGGENLRASPNGERLGRARGGMLLDRLETRDGWLRVRRTGWIWGPSIEAYEDAEGRVVATDPDSIPSTAAPPAAAPTRAFAAAHATAVVLDAPGGDTLARLSPGASVEVLAREEGWTRVRLEGWARTGALADPDSAGGGVLTDIPRDSLQAVPERFRGRLVEWPLQFIALQEAERFRTDFLEGEPFVLARGPGDDPGFVYLAVPPALVPTVSRLAPLQEVRVLGRVRTARSALTGAPILDLLEIRPR